MFMVSWIRALRAAIVTILYSLAWYVVGIILAGFGGFLISGSFYSLLYSFFSPMLPSEYSPHLSPVEPITVIAGILLILVGVFVMVLGTLATFYKVVSEVVADEVQGKVTIVAAMT
jgi:hypothetical protein